MKSGGRAAEDAHRGAGMATLNEIMTAEVYSTTGDVSVAEVANSMVKGRFGSAVVMEGSMLVGIFTERDVLRAAASGADLTSSPVSEWMTRDPVTAALDMDADDAAEIMMGQGFRHLPVVDGTCALSAAPNTARVSSDSCRRHRTRSRWNARGGVPGMPSTRPRRPRPASARSCRRSPGSWDPHPRAAAAGRTDSRTPGTSIRRSAPWPECTPVSVCGRGPGERFWAPTREPDRLTFWGFHPSSARGRPVHRTAQGKR